MNIFLRLVFAFCVLVCMPCVSFAANFYVDPQNGAPTGDGSAAHPWRTIEEVIAAKLIETQTMQNLPYVEGAPLKVVNPGAPIKGGDTIYLRSGYHGQIYLDSYSGGRNTFPITIAAAPGHTPRVKRVFLRAATNWIIKGLSISPSHAPSYEQLTIVDINNHGWQGPSSDITIENCDIFTKWDSSTWDLAQWLANMMNGINVDGDRSKIINNRLRNINFGISVNGKNVLVSRNQILNFGGDGMRGIGDYGTFEYNVVENAIELQNGNHDDGFQSWSVGTNGQVGTGVVKGIVLRGNIFLSTMALNSPLRSSFQGIGCFDGFFEDWIVENNVVIVDHWHGITLMGARNSRIVNNTVIDLYPGTPGPSWIAIDPHKNGTIGTGNIVRNNLANSFRFTASGVTGDHNVPVNDPNVFFVNPAGFDLRLKAGSSALDAGARELAPTTDILGAARPYGNGVDLGAYEYIFPDTVLPTSPNVSVVK